MCLSICELAGVQCLCVCVGACLFAFWFVCQYAVHGEIFMLAFAAPVVLVRFVCVCVCLPVHSCVLAFCGSLFGSVLSMTVRCMQLGHVCAYRVT